jgi:hypothetical protein
MARYDLPGFFLILSFYFSSAQEIQVEKGKIYKWDMQKDMFVNTQ